MRSIRASFLHLLISIRHRVDVLNLSYGGNGEYPIAVLCRGVSPWCSCGASTGRPQKSTSSREFKGSLLQAKRGARHRGAAVAMQVTTNASCAEVPPGTANTFRRNTFGCILDEGDQPP